MSQNCKTTCTTATSRDANNNTLYHGTGQTYSGRYSPSRMNNANYQNLTAKVLFGSVTAINDLRQEKAEREVRRTH